MSMLSPYVQPVARAGMGALSRKLSTALNTVQSSPATTAFNSQMRGGLGGIGQRKSRRGRRRRSRSKVNRPLSTDCVTATLKGTLQLNAITTTGNYAGMIWLGYKNTNSTAYLSGISIPFSGLANVYQFFELLHLKAEFMPIAADTASASISLCIDTNVANAENTATVTQIMDKRGSVTADIKSPCVFNWTPENEQERETKMTNDASGITVSNANYALLRAYAPGLLSFNASTNLTSSAALLGYLIVTVTARFSEAI